MSDIERARVRIAAMRAAATPGRWIHDCSDILSTDPNHDGVVAYTSGPDAELIVTMLDPDVLEALDGMLMSSEEVFRPSPQLQRHAERIASKFLAAADRVQA